MLKKLCLFYFLLFTHPPPLFKSDTLDFQANKYLSNVSWRVNEGNVRSGKQRGKGEGWKKKSIKCRHTQRKRGGGGGWEGLRYKVGLLQAC